MTPRTPGVTNKQQVHLYLYLRSCDVIPPLDIDRRGSVRAGGGAANPALPLRVSEGYPGVVPEPGRGDGGRGARGQEEVFATAGRSARGGLWCFCVYRVRNQSKTSQVPPQVPGGRDPCFLQPALLVYNNKKTMNLKGYNLHLHLGHLADAFIQSDLQRVHFEGVAALWYLKIRIELLSSIPIYETNRTSFIIAKLPA